MPDLANVQSIVARTTALPRHGLLLFRLGSVDGARKFLAECLPDIPSARLEGLPSQPLQLGVTWPGLAKLVPAPLIAEDGAAALESDFVREWPDNPAVAPQAGFRGKSAPELWWDGQFTTGDVELIVHVAASEAEFEARREEVRALAAMHGLEHLVLPGRDDGALSGFLPPGGVLHFGYRDGITHPAVDWVGDGSAPVDFREFLLGYPSDDYPTSPRSPGPWQDFVRDGSFGCIAWIRQDVAAFNRLLDDVAAGLPLADGIDKREWLAARMMGRWRDGSPVSRWPDAPPSNSDHDDAFGFAADPAGRLCPLNAHIRIVNMRDDPMPFRTAARFPKGPPRFQRRGFSYGPPLEGSEDDGRERGIIGLFFCARINEQFYTILRWMQKTTFADGFFEGSHTDRMQDPIVGLGDMPRADRRLLLGPDAAGAEIELRDLVTFRGVVCALFPSLDCLERLAQG